MGEKHNIVYRDKICNEITVNDIGNTITLSGWIYHIRKKKKFVWIDLRDFYGIVQLFIEDINKFSCAKQLVCESIITVRGEVHTRPNFDNSTNSLGLEVHVLEITILSTCKQLPFPISKENLTEENIRLKYRFLDLRREEMRRNLILRHKVALLSRSFLLSKGFIEVDTPCLTKSSVSGAREFLVLTEKHKGKAFYLSQSPQLYMQLLILAGFDRCFQIAHCFCDEDLRTDRQPEFHQLHCEMAFSKQEDVLALFEEFIQFIYSKVNNKALDKIPILSWEDCMKKYNTDKPDNRKVGDKVSALWVVDIPMFKFDKTENRYKSVHHPFVAPKNEDIPLLFDNKNIEKIRTQSYNLIINGVKVGGSSVRIADERIQNRVFQILNLTDKEINDNYGFLLEAFKFGIPPHAGMTFGFDRLCAIMDGSNNVRDYMAFPKNSKGKDIMFNIPEPIKNQVLNELGLTKNDCPQASEES